MARQISSPIELKTYAEEVCKKKERWEMVIAVCGGTGCSAFGSYDVRSAFTKEVEKLSLSDRVLVKMTGCHGFCEKGPVTIIYPWQYTYVSIKPEDVPEVIEKTIIKKELVDRLLYRDPVTKQRIKHNNEIPFYAHQKRLVFQHNGHLDPTSIDDYISVGGYQALAKALFEMTPEQVLVEVEKSGLRGRGGAGFPTGRKWRFCRNSPGSEKYIICNGDEGDPGAFMDRSVMEGNPHSVIEGMIIGAYAIGATKGFVYVRAEYPIAVKYTRLAIEQAHQYGLLGENILGSGFSFDIEVREGAGAFVCGEETALIASIEGKRGMPRPRPPFPAVSGLWGKPTNINNVETWANVPLIINKGADWFASIGTAESKGTKTFSLVGKINNTGIVEVPLGITLREIIYDIGGGISGGRKFKAVQTGGPSGGCIPEWLLDTPVDYERLTELGSMMGSGGMIVMDEGTCMIDVARYFMKFLSEESCGKCVPCREGIDRALDILTDITEGKGRKEDISLLEELGEVLKDGSLCGLGRTAANPVLSTIKYFRNEYEAHINEKKCPAGVCKALITFSIDEEKCKSCGKCAKVCPTKAASGKKKEPYKIDKEKCIKCGLCRESCKFGAVIVS
ncbi:MAG: NADH-quinone oxidoreductase subunit NuoF [Planctomycetota bacterium]|nr:NADH-quinone oxidoreductase subunit NuoF [Planctomycetota bacterium]